MELNCRLRFRVFVLGPALLFVAVANSTARADDGSFIRGLDTVSTISTTVPANGDVNPYGIARVPRTKGRPG